MQQNLTDCGVFVCKVCVQIMHDSRGISVLQRNLAVFGLALHGVVPRDGNCMFHALAEQLRRLGMGRYRHMQLRNLVCNYLESNPYVVSLQLICCAYTKHVCKNKSSL